jgi:hypothetical protein
LGSTEPPAKARLVSTVGALPVLGFSRRFCPVSETIRSRSGTGLKSTPNAAPLRAKRAVVIAVARPVTGSMRYRRPLWPACVTPYSCPVAGRTSMPTKDSPVPCPVIGSGDDTVPGRALENVIRLSPAVKP